MCVQGLLPESVHVCLCGGGNVRQRETDRRQTSRHHLDSDDERSSLSHLHGHVRPKAGSLLLLALGQGPVESGLVLSSQLRFEDYSFGGRRDQVPVYPHFEELDVVSAGAEAICVAGLLLLGR